MKAYEPVTLTHMQAYLLQFVLARSPLADGQVGASRALSDLYEQIQGTPSPDADEVPPGAGAHLN